ncbi:hypothetical protein [Calothrix sp. CCY 0018]|uniref:hypothetical protein n=1 Tax=Calothrix sp. CCY 0018 TaxID=3103864 RepID=UPI0039C63A1C
MDIIPGLTLPLFSENLPKAPEFSNLIGDTLKGIFSPAVKASLDVDIDIGVKKEVWSLVDHLFDKLKILLGDIAYVADELLSKTEEIGKNLIQKISQELSGLVQQVQRAVNDILSGIKDNLINPFFEKVDELRRNLVEDIRSLINQILNGAGELAGQLLKEGDRILTGTISEFKSEVEKVVNFSRNPFDPCRIKFDLGWVPGHKLTIGDLHNLFECSLLRRLEEGDTVKEIKTIYADLQHRSWHLSCVARGTVPGISSSSALQDIAIKDWIKYGQLYSLWNQFEDNMTPLTALENRIKQLEDEIAYFRAKSAQIDDVSTAVQTAQQTAEAAQNAANNAQKTANDGVAKANNAQKTANDGVAKANNAQKTANNALDLANQINGKTRYISVHGATTMIDAGGCYLAIQADGNIVVYKDGGGAIWASGSHG